MILTIFTGAHGRLHIYEGDHTNFEHLHHSGSFKTFLSKLEDAEDTLNLLDFPRTDGDCPDIIQLLSDDLHAFRSTFALGTSTRRKRPSPDPTKPGPGLMQAGSDNSQPITPSILQADRIMNSGGPEIMEHDVNRARRWALASQHTFFTYPHYDASGFCTWSMITTGTKVWSYISLDVSKTRTLQEASQQSINLASAAATTDSVDAPEVFPKLATAHNLFLTPGTLL